MPLSTVIQSGSPETIVRLLRKRENTCQTLDGQFSIVCFAEPWIGEG